LSRRVELAREAEKDLDRLDRNTEARVRRRLRELALTPFDPRISRPLKGVSDLRASRVGDWRILYMVQEEVVIVLAIRPRGRAYRRL